jgi:hypothetical protein
MFGFQQPVVDGTRGVLGFVQTRPDARKARRRPIRRSVGELRRVGQGGKSTGESTGASSLQAQAAASGDRVAAQLAVPVHGSLGSS